MHKHSLSLFLALLVGLAAHTARAQAVADNPANRQTQADRYLQAQPPQELIDNMTKGITANVPAGPQRDQMLKMLTSGIDIAALTKAMKEALVKHFTADELKAMADFYSSPLGKSAQSKMGDYQADLAPAIRAQMMKAMGGGPGAAPQPAGGG
jgi:hypothetical protein